MIDGGDGYVYIASPYTHDNDKVEHLRYESAVLFTGQTLADGVACFSPIVHCRRPAEVCDLPGDFEFWRAYNFAMLSRARELWVLMLPGWEESDGVAGEIEEAQRLGIPVRYVEWGR